MLGVINVTDNHESCVFCDYIKNRNFVMDNDYAIAVYDNFPVNKGHMLIIPKRHFASFLMPQQMKFLLLMILSRKLNPFLIIS